MAKDGYAGLFIVPDEGAQPAIVSNEGSLTFRERTERTGRDSTISIAELIIGDTTSVQLSSGSITDISIELRKDALSGIGLITFDTNPAHDPTTDYFQTSNGAAGTRKYYFVDTLTAVEQVKIGSDPEETMANLHKTINLTGSEGTEYYTGQTIDPYVSSHYNSGRTLTLKAKVSGTASNVYTLTATVGEISLFTDTSDKLYGGVAEENYIYQAKFQAINNDGSNYWYSTTGNKGTFRIPGIANSPSGIPYKARIKFFNSDGQIAKDSGGTDIVIDSSVVDFDGIDDVEGTLTEYIEVNGLEVVNASNVDGHSTPVALPPGGIARLQWEDMKTYTTKLLGQPTGGGGTQDVSEKQIATITEYAVFMYIDAGGVPLSPAQEYPVRGTDSNGGTWYLIGRTEDNFLEVQCPKNKNIAFWVGFGTPQSIINTDTPIGVKLPYSEY